MNRLKIKLLSEDEIDEIISSHLRQWILEDRQDIGIGTIRRKQLAHAIAQAQKQDEEEIKQKNRKVKIAIGKNERTKK